MKIIKLLFITGIIFWLSASSYARHIEASPDVLSFRPVGEIRIWTYNVKDTIAGRLTSLVFEKTEVDNEPAVSIRQTLNLNFAPAGTDLKYGIQGERFVGLYGHYLGDELSLKVNDVMEKLSIRREGNHIVGYADRDGNKRSFETTFEGFSADNLYLDQHELYLAMHDIAVGDTLTDSLFVPTAMQTTPLLAVVEDFINKQLYNQVFDSVFVIRYLQPFQGTFYFTPGKRLVKAEIPGQRIKAYLDLVRQADIPQEVVAEVKDTPPKKSPLPRIIIYIFMGLIVWAFFIAPGMRWLPTYLAFGAGAVSFLIVIFTQYPLQDYLFTEVLLSKVNAGGSGYFWAIFPAISAGFIQEILKFAILLGVIRLAVPSTRRLICIGSTIGVGFAIAESCYIGIIGVPGDLFSWHLLERGFVLLYHALAGALIGYAMQDGLSSKSWRYYLLGLILLNSFLHYLPVFVQNRVVTVEVMYLLLPVIVLCLLFWTMMKMKETTSD